MMMTFFVIHFLNIGNGNVQTSGKFSNEFAIDNSAGSLITPYLAKFDLVPK